MQGITAGKHNTKNTSEGTTIYEPCFNPILPHTHTIKIYHQNICSLRNKTEELLCHLNLEPPHLLCITEHHLHYDELASLHIENYTLGAHYCKKSKQKGSVCVFVHNGIKFVSLDINNYCIDQDFEARAIHLSSMYDNLCILTIYRAPLGNFNAFLSKLDQILHKFFNLNFNFMICGDFNVNYLLESYKKNQLDKTLQSFNLCSIVNFPTRIESNSSSITDKFFIDYSYLNKFDIIPLMNGLSDHYAQLLTIQFALTQNKDQHMYFKRNLNHYTTDFLLTLSYETWESVFEDNDINTIFNSFLNTFLGHFYFSFPVVKANKPLNHNSWITLGI